MPQSDDAGWLSVGWLSELTGMNPTALNGQLHRLCHRIQQAGVGDSDALIEYRGDSLRIGTTLTRIRAAYA